VDFSQLSLSTKWSQVGAKNEMRRDQQFALYL